MLAGMLSREFAVTCSTTIDSPESWERLVTHKLQTGRWGAVVRILGRADIPGYVANSILAKVAPSLARHVPARLLKLWESSTEITADDMLPALVEITGTSCDNFRSKREAELEAEQALLAAKKDMATKQRSRDDVEQEEGEGDAVNDGEDADADAEAEAEAEEEAAAARAAAEAARDLAERHAAAAELTSAAREALAAVAPSAEQAPPLSRHERSALELCNKQFALAATSFTSPGGIGPDATLADEETGEDMPSRPVIDIMMDWLVRDVASRSCRLCHIAAEMAEKMALQAILEARKGRDAGAASAAQEDDAELASAKASVDQLSQELRSAAFRWGRQSESAAGGAAGGEARAGAEEEEDQEVLVSAVDEVENALEELGDAALQAFRARQEVRRAGTAKGREEQGPVVGAAAASSAAVAEARGSASPPPTAGTGETSAIVALGEAQSSIAALAERARRALVRVAEASGACDALLQLVHKGVALRETEEAGPARASVDLERMLRTCTLAKCRGASAELFASLGMWEEGVKSALTFDIELAKDIARTVQGRPPSEVFRVGEREIVDAAELVREQEERDAAAGDAGPSDSDGLASPPPATPSAAVAGDAGLASKALRQAPGLTRSEHWQLVHSLWQRIAEAAAEGTERAEAALRVLEEANLAAESMQWDDIVGDDEEEGVSGEGARKVLTIDDILSLLPDSARIQEFKDQLVKELKTSAAESAQLKRDMDAFSKSAQRIRQQTEALRNRTVELRPGQPCMLCGQAVTAREFYVFATRNAYHRDCLVAEVRRGMSTQSRAAFDAVLIELIECRAKVMAEAEKERRRAAERGEAAAGDGGARARLSVAARRLQQLKDYIDCRVAAQDPLTGSAMIDSVSRPLDAYCLGGPSFWAELAARHSRQQAEASAPRGGGATSAAAALFRGRRVREDKPHTLKEEFDLEAFFDGLDWSV